MAGPSLVRPTEEIAEFFARDPSAEEIAAFRLSEATLARVRTLRDKNAEWLGRAPITWTPAASTKNGGRRTAGTAEWAGGGGGGLGA